MLTLKKSRPIASLLVAVPLIAALSACGTMDIGDGGSTPDPPESQKQTFDTFEQYQLAFADCMRGKGIEMEDPKDEGLSVTRSDDEFMEAAETCRSEIGQPPAREGDTGSGGDSADALREEHLKIAECLREHGVDVLDPAPGKDLAIPSDAPVDALETCAPNGVVGSTTRGN